MTAPAAILGTFVKMESISTRKQVRIQIEIPEEQADAVLEALGGYPRPSNPVWVAVARVTKEAAERASKVVLDQPKIKRAWSDLSAAQQAGIRCNEEAFWKFLNEDGYGGLGDGSDVVEDAQKAATYVRLICGVKTRSDLDKNPEAKAKWNDLESSYQIWLANPEG